MTIYDIPNIEHCDVALFGSLNYRIVAHEGWYIHLPTYEPGINEDGSITKIYKGAAIIRTDYDFSTVEITAEADLPENAEICGDTGNDHEVM